MEQAKRPGSFMNNEEIDDTLLSTEPQKSVPAGDKTDSFLVLEMNSTTAKGTFLDDCVVWDWRSAMTVNQFCCW